MPLFLSLFLATVCSFNIFNWWKFRAAFLPTSFWGSVLLLLIFLFLAVLPLSLRIFFRGHGNAPDWLEQASWIWLAWAFWLSAIFLVLELWNLGALTVWNLQMGRSAVGTAGACRCWALSPTATVFLATSLVFFGTCWGIVEARAVAVNRLVVSSSRIPVAADGFRVLLLSDLHLGSSLTHARLRKIIAISQQQQADLILSAGDLLDGAGEREQSMAEMLGELSAPQGSFACLGNHDVYVGLERARQLHTTAGFQLLEDEGMALNEWLWLAAINDPAITRENSNENHKNAAKQVNLLPPENDTNKFVVLMKHRPEPEPMLDQQQQPIAALQVSGHTHNGQIFPFNFLVRLQHRWKTGRLHQLAKESYFYISPGTGTWGPPFRLLARPEVTVITLRHQQ